MIEILDENNFFLVLFKPQGVSVHNQSPSLVEFLTKNKRPLHFVNRLDQETSGLMVIAQKPEYHNELSLALEQGSKIYRALLRGTWKKTEANLILNWPLTDKAEGRRNPQGESAQRKPCETHLQIVRSNTYFSEVLAEIKTGRQHQIRKHMALLKQPIVGDKRYNDDAYNARIAEMYKKARTDSSRLFLQAEKTSFLFKNQKYSYEKPFHLNEFFI